ncbi:type II CAAX endopeptidase family protein [Rhodohalobacter halophilus]|uniref:type II CAAX endopeptidase family protein n=1 Tax=Rhodohalobacter halophilus TaxID=1812810 RepID=UPI00083F663A|nr:type II CAAX endopeptidase family protein [Rhodohalobacter halophilus]
MTLNSTDSSTTQHTVQSWAERNGFADWAIALIWLIVAFVMFQLTAGIIFLALMFFSGEISSSAEVEQVLMNRLDLLFVGNSTGQILFLGIASFLIARLHLSRRTVTEFLRLRWKQDTPVYILLGALLVVVVQPVILYLGYFNSLLPIPESWTDMQVSQYEMFEQFLKTDGIVWFGLFHIALVPAFCEELLFRGYILRAFQKSWGIFIAIIVSGLIFGLFHLQVPNLLPLASLGILLAVMTWLSRSLWPAIVAHFVNNGGAVLLATTYPELAFGDVTAESLPSVWLLLVSIILTGGVIYTMIHRTEAIME